MSGLTSSLASKVRDPIMDHKTFKQNWKITVLEDNSVSTMRGAVPYKPYEQKEEIISKNQQSVVNVINELDCD